jgi:hypothetical protein
MFFFCSPFAVQQTLGDFFVIELLPNHVENSGELKATVYERIFGD